MSEESDNQSAVAEAPEDSVPTVETQVIDIVRLARATRRHWEELPADLAAAIDAVLKPMYPYGALGE